MDIWSMRDCKLVPSSEYLGLSSTVIANCCSEHNPSTYSSTDTPDSQLRENRWITMQSTKKPIALYPAYITQAPTMLIVKQHFNASADGDFTCFRADSSVLFEVVGQQKSSSRRRQLVDPATGASLFQLRRRYLNLKEQWYLEFPENATRQSAQPRFSVAMKWKGWANFDIIMTNMAPSTPESICLEIRARSVRHTTWDVLLDGQNIIEARKIPGKEAPGETARIRNNPAWELDVVAGVDLSLVSTLAEKSGSDILVLIWLRHQ